VTIPASRRWAIASWLALAVLLAACALQKLWSADTWTLLAIGRWVREHQAWPSTEEWTWSASGREWIELRWLFCVPMDLLYERIGPWAPSLAGTFLVALAFAALLRPFRAATPAALAISALGLFAGITRWVVRPELATYTMLALFLVLLERDRRGLTSRRAVWWLLPLQVLWTNAHGMFVFGPIVAWVFAGDAVLRSWSKADPASTRPFRSCLLAAAISAACLLNPYGWRGAEMPWILLRESTGVLSAHIDELGGVFSTPLRHWRPDTWAMFALLAVPIAGAVRAWRKPDPARLVILIMAFDLAIGPVRNAGLVAIMGTWLALQSLDDWDPARACMKLPSRLGIATATLGLAWFVASDRYWCAVGSTRQWGAGVVPGMTAQGAADFVLANGLRGRLYNGFGDGGYLIWRRVLPVYVDGRTEVHDAAFWANYFGPKTESWSAWADREGVGTAIVPRQGYEWLAEGLPKLSGWMQVYADERDLVFMRNRAP
jgi:hypothetical protein